MLKETETEDIDLFVTFLSLVAFQLEERRTLWAPPLATPVTTANSSSKGLNLGSGASFSGLAGSLLDLPGHATVILRPRENKSPSVLQRKIRLNGLIILNFSCFV